MNLASLSLTEQRELIKSKQVRPADLAADCYRQIEKLNPTLNAFITVIPPEQAQPLEDAQAAPLYGIPIAAKDLYDTQGIRTTSGAKFFAENIPQADAVVVDKIKKAGAQIIGKTNTHEIALGLTNNNPHYGACRNPWDTTRVPGGSSGGSAVAVATGMATAALGTDTGGSIRVPAALCGVTGFKPTFGRVSLRGVLPLSWNLDHAGPITRTAEDAALMLQTISGYDEADPASINQPVGDYLLHLKDSIKGHKIAFAVGDYVEEADAEVTQAVREAALVLKKLGAVITDVNADFLKEAAFANALTTQSDGAAFHRDRMKEHPDWFGADVRQRLETGAAFTSTEYILARRVQTEFKRKCDLLFKEYDVFILPTSAVSAPVLEGENAIERARQLTRFTAPFNLAGVPALTVPCGFTSEGLPVGLQIISRAWDEASALRVGYAFQQASDWHTKRPAL